MLMMIMMMMMSLLPAADNNNHPAGWWWLVYVCCFACGDYLDFVVVVDVHESLDSLDLPVTVFDCWCIAVVVRGWHGLSGISDDDLLNYY